MKLIILRRQCSYGTHDVDRRIVGDSSQRSPFFASDAFNPYDGPALAMVPSRIEGGQGAVQSADFRSSQFITQPGSRIAFQLAQFADHPERLWAAWSDHPTVGSQKEIGKFERVFDKADLPIDLLDPGRGFPSALLMAPIGRVEQSWAIPLVKTGTVDRAPIFLKQVITPPMQRPGSIAQGRLQDH